MGGEKLRERAEICGQRELCPGVFDLRLRAPGIAAGAAPGQFVNLYLNDSSRILPRPLSLCGIDREKGVLRLVYRVTAEGSGTAWLSGCGEGVFLYALGPLGRGFPCGAEDACVVGGGIGIPPLLETLKSLRGKKTAVLGYRSAGEMFLREEFEAEACELQVATEDGSFGTRGTVLDALEKLSARPKVILSCGPRAMLRSLKAYASERSIELWVSMEERMACGIGACLACVTESAEVDGHSGVRNKRVCKDGPVFRAEEVIL